MVVAGVAMATVKAAVKATVMDARNSHCHRVSTVDMDGHTDTPSTVVGTQLKLV